MLCPDKVLVRVWGFFVWVNLFPAVDGMKISQTVVAIEHFWGCEATNFELRRSTMNLPESHACFSPIRTSGN